MQEVKNSQNLKIQAICPKFNTYSIASKLELAPLITAEEKYVLCIIFPPPVSQAVTRSSLKREVLGSILDPVRSNTVLPTVFTAAAFLPKELGCEGSMTRR